MIRIKKPEPPTETRINRPTDCDTCENGIKWKYGLFECKMAKVPVENCLKRNIECVNYKRK